MMVEWIDHLLVLGSVLCTLYVTLFGFYHSHLHMCCHTHFRVEEMGSEKLRELPEVTYLVRVGSRFWTPLI